METVKHPGRVLRQLLFVRGYTLAAVARECGTSRQAVAQVLRGVSRSSRIETYVCKLLRTRRDAFFPPLQRRRSTPPVDTQDDQTEEAAEEPIAS